MIVNIPVSPMSRAILLNTHRCLDDETIIVTGHDLLHGHLSHRWLDKAKNKVSHKLLTSSINMKISRRLAKLIDDHVYQAGFYLYNLHKEYLYTYIYGAVNSGVPAMQALKTFYVTHGLSDDDYDLETAYRTWDRFLKRKNTKNTTLHFRKCATFDMIKGRSKRTLLWTNQGVVDQVGHVVAKHIDLFFFKNGKFDELLLEKCIDDCLRMYAKIPETDLAASRNITERALRYRLKSFRDLLSYESSLKKTIIELFENTTPSYI